MSVLSLNLAANVLLHMLILFMFLSVLFIYYISGVITSALNNELSHAVKDAMATVKDKLKSSMQGLPVSGLEKAYSIPDPVVTINNSWLFTMLMVLSVLFAVIVIMFIGFIKIYDGDKIHLKRILLENLVIFALIGVIELWFFTNVASKFVPIAPSHVKSQFIKNVNKSIQE
jgi:hypothetical protein